MSACVCVLLVWLLELPAAANDGALLHRGCGGAALDVETPARCCRRSAFARMRRCCRIF
jgi:hypothetical protein